MNPPVAGLYLYHTSPNSCEERSNFLVPLMQIGTMIKKKPHGRKLLIACSMHQGRKT
jgi:hypothetical protein